MIADPSSVSPRGPRANGPLRVLVVDDSLIFRGAVTEALAGNDDLHVVGSVRNGRKAMEFLRERPVDVVTLDLEMPDMDGLETLRAIRRLNHDHRDRPPVGVIMLSAHTRHGAQATLAALEAGAFDFVAKPDAADPGTGLRLLRDQLALKLRAFARNRARGRGRAEPTPRAAVPTGGAAVSRVTRRGSPVVLIGVSTGGPRALADMLPELVERVSAPVLVVQHMPPVFTGSLAESLQRRCRCPVAEARDDEPVVPRRVYIAPGGLHMTVRRNRHGREVIGVNDQPAEIGCKPSVNMLFRSAATVYGSGAVALVLTGMGSDGTAGLAPLRRAGVRILAQDGPTSVVWGMPGSAVSAGLVDEVLPLHRIPSAVEHLLRHQARG